MSFREAMPFIFRYAFLLAFWRLKLRRLIRKPNHKGMDKGNKYNVNALIQYEYNQFIRAKSLRNKTVDSQRGFMSCSILFYKLYATCYDTLFLKNEEPI